MSTLPIRALVRSTCYDARQQFGCCRYRRQIRVTLSTNASSDVSRAEGNQFQVGDRVLVTHRVGRNVKTRLLPPLRPDGATSGGLHGFEIKHSDIIGKPSARLFVPGIDTTKKGKTTEFRVSHPTFEEFTAQSPRTVTPIYSSYCANIVSLLDIHVAPPQPTNHPASSGVPRLEILEAGTGHGSLTLHLARAIAAANPLPPSAKEATEDNAESEIIKQAWSDWRQERRAVVNTIEYVSSRSRDAQKLIRSFRGGIYWPHIDFNSGDVADWITKQQEDRQQRGESKEFLDIVILDMPEVHQKIEQVVSALKEGGQLLVYVPQITQLAACQHEMQRAGLRLKLEQVVELGEGISNGRVWDLRFVRTRAEQKLESAFASEVSEASEASEVSENISSDKAAEVETSSVVDEDPVVTAKTSDPQFPTMVCRPMVGKLVMGGAFVGLWTKIFKRAEGHPSD